MEMIYEGNLRTRAVHASGVVLVTDAPKDNHGKGEFFSPTDLLALALGSCVLTLMGIAAERLKVDLNGLRASVEKTMVTAPVRKIGRVVVRVYCPEVFEPWIVEELEKAGSTCPVHYSLHPDIEQQIEFKWGAV